MITQIFYGIIIPSFGNVMLWLEALFNATGAIGIYMAMISVFLVVRYVCGPFLAAASSDLARHNLERGKRGAKNFYKNHVTNRTPTTSRLRRISDRAQRRR